LSREELVDILDKVIEALDRIEALIARLSVSEEASKGVVYQIYQNLIEAREEAVRARLIARNLSSGKSE
jgi:phosphoglycerate-specific signal transduction histidine kinase